MAVIVMVWSVKIEFQSAKGTIAGEDETAVFVAFGDEFEEDTGFGLVFSHVAQVIENETVNAIEFG
jgi:hypothetical protein